MMRYCRNKSDCWLCTTKRPDFGPIVIPHKWQGTPVLVQFSEKDCFSRFSTKAALLPHSYHVFLSYVQYCIYCTWDGLIVLLALLYVPCRPEQSRTVGIILALSFQCTWATEDRKDNSTEQKRERRRLVYFIYMSNTLNQITFPDPKHLCYFLPHSCLIHGLMTHKKQKVMPLHLIKGRVFIGLVQDSDLSRFWHRGAD